MPTPSRSKTEPGGRDAALPLSRIEIGGIVPMPLSPLRPTVFGVQPESEESEEDVMEAKTGDFGRMIAPMPPGAGGG